MSAQDDNRSFKGDWVNWRGYGYLENPDIDVFEAAYNRIHAVYSTGLPVSVSFSGGKDSTCILMLCLKVAKDMDKLPVNVFFQDEEIYDPDTLSYVEQVNSWPEVKFYWCCVRAKHTLKSKNRNHWHTWDEEYRDVWVRSMPEGAVTQKDLALPLSDEAGYKELSENLFIHTLGWKEYYDILGIRMDEAFNRRRSMLVAGSYISYAKLPHKVSRPIYDWKVDDVWKAILENDWPHSAYYDKMWLKEVPLPTQRIAAWGNVADRTVRFYPELYPDFWEKAIRRLPELRANARYGSSKIFREAKGKPDSMSYQEYIHKMLLPSLPEEDQKFWLKLIEGYLRDWAQAATFPMPDEEVIMGQKCWKKIAMAMSKNDRVAGSTRDRV